MKRWLFLLLSCWQVNLFALDNITLELGTVAAPGWQAEQVVAQLHWRNDQTIALTLTIAKLTLPSIKMPLTQLRLECPQTQYTVKQIACSRAKLHWPGGLLDKPILLLSFTYLVTSQRLDFRITQLALAEANITVTVTTTATQWEADVRINSLNLEQLLTKLTQWLELPIEFTLAGHTSWHLTVLGTNKLMTVKLEGQANGFTYSNPEGNQAGENLKVQFSLQATQPFQPLSATQSSTSLPWQLQGTLAIHQGEIYSDPIYVNLNDQPVSLNTDLSWQPTELTINSMTYSHPTVGILQGSGRFKLGETFAINHLTLQLSQGNLSELYTRYLQSWLGDAQTLTGRIEGQLEWGPDKHYWQVNLSQVNVDDKQQRFSIQEVNGLLQWHNQSTELPSHLRWSKATLWSKLNLGPSQIKVSFTNSRLKLLAPWQQPLLDGAITIAQFNLEDLGGENLQWTLQGKLTPISMQTLSMALGGPPLTGQLAADIPPLNYQHHQLSMAHHLQIQLFDGNVIITALQLLLGEVSELYTNIEIDKINLKTLTQVTKFGEIQGQLSGYLHGLHLVNWQPVSFDAYFATPTDNKLPKKISQKAIDNLSNLGGGGVVNAISKSVLRMFENFSYNRLGWGCQLRNGICQMQGVEMAKSGYYIVKGGGLPRIDVIGYNTSVDWNELLSRLKRISQVDTPVIK